MKAQFMIAMGTEVKDTITGFSGKVVARCEYITGCNQYLITPGVDKEGSLRDSTWVDEQRIELVPDTQPVILDNSQRTGFGPPAPKK